MSVTRVVMPALGESVTEATVTRWLKNPGDRVVNGEPLLEVATDKVDTEVEAPASGVLMAVLVTESTTVDVGTEIARIETSDLEPVPPVSVLVPALSDATYTVSTVVDGPRSTFLSPAVRALVRNQQVDLEGVAGSGARGRVTRRDVLAKLAGRASSTSASTAAPAAPPIPAAASTPAEGAVHLSTLRKTIATRMLESLRVSAQLTTVVEVDVTPIDRARKAFQESRADAPAVKLSHLAFIARATCETLAAHPELNASVDLEAGTVTYHKDVHLGIAVDTERGLMVPVIPAANDLNVRGLARRISDVAKQTRDRQVSVDELTGGTFTITNTGSRGALFDTPILNQPQVGILGFGAVVRRPVVIAHPTGEEVIAVRSMAHLALTYDHRLVDGADAARFLARMKARIETEPFDVA